MCLVWVQLFAIKNFRTLFQEIHAKKQDELPKIDSSVENLSFTNKHDRSLACLLAA